MTPVVSSWNCTFIPIIQHFQMFRDIIPEIIKQKQKNFTQLVA